MDFIYSPTFIALVIGFCIGTLINYFSSKKRIEKIGNIKCDRCDYQGKPTQNGLCTKIICPGCGSERWKKI